MSTVWIYSIAGKSTYYIKIVDDWLLFLELSIFLLLNFCLFLGTESAREGSLSSKIETKNTNTIERESSMPISSILVKKSMEENKNNNKSTEENKNFSNPSEHRQISRERVDKGNFFQKQYFLEKIWTVLPTSLNVSLRKYGSRHTFGKQIKRKERFSSNTIFKNSLKIWQKKVSTVVSYE